MIRSLIVLLILSNGCYANTVTEVLEFFAKNFVRETAEAGGKTAIKKQLMKIASKYGDEALLIVRSVGPESIRVITKYGPDSIRILSRFGNAGLWTLQKSGKHLVYYCRLYGDEAAIAFIEHPGLGKTILHELGSSGINIAKKLTTEEMIQLLRIAPKLRRVGLMGKAIEQIQRFGSNALKIIMKYPLTATAFAGGVYVISQNEPGKAIGKEVGSAVGSTIEYIAVGIFHAVWILLIPLLLVAMAIHLRKK